MPVGNEEFVYIACQGPLPTTVADFWQMTWEQNCSIIAMMTQEVEGEKIKCQRYWPNVLGKTIMVNDRLRLALVRLQQLKGFVIRVLDLEDIQVSESSHSALGGFLGELGGCLFCLFGMDPFSPATADVNFQILGKQQDYFF